MPDTILGTKDNSSKQLYKFCPRSAYIRVGIEALENKVKRGAGSRVEAQFNRMVRKILTDETRFEP